MKRISILMFLLAIRYGADCQQLTFDKLVVYPDSNNITSSSLAESFQIIPGGYIVQGGGWAPRFGGWESIKLIRIDSLGNVLWKKQYGKVNFAYYGGSGGNLQKLLDGNFVFAGRVSDSISNEDQILLFKFDLNGDTIFTKTYGASGLDMGLGCLASSDGGFYTLAYSENWGNSTNNVILLKTDSIGNFEWKKDYGQGGTEEVATNLVYNNEGDIVFYQGILYCGGSTTTIRKVSPVDGHVLFSSNYTGRCGGMAVPTFDHGYAITGNYPPFDNSYVMKTNANGTILWEHELGADTLLEPWNMIETDDSCYVIIGDAQNPQGGKVWGAICKFSKSGQLLWHHKYDYGGNNPNYLWDLKQTSDKGFMCTGTAWDSTEQGMWLLKLDSNGCLTPGCLEDTTVDTTAIRDILPHQYGVSVVPNPMHDETVITVDIEQGIIFNANQIDFSLYSIEGRKQEAEFSISHPDSYRDPHQLIIHLHRSNLSEGMYLFNVSIKGVSVAKGKVVME